MLYQRLFLRAFPSFGTHHAVCVLPTPTYKHLTLSKTTILLPQIYSKAIGVLTSSIGRGACVQEPQAGAKCYSRKQVKILKGKLIKVEMVNPDCYVATSYSIQCTRLLPSDKPMSRLLGPSLKRNAYL